MPISLHLADHRPRPMKYACLAYGQEFPERGVAPDSRGDPCCPLCGSLRLDRVPQHGEGARRFLLRYNQL